MVTARSRFGIRWVRSVASPLRLLCLAALMLGFVSLHAVSAEAVSGHLAGCASPWVASAAYGGIPESPKTPEEVAESGAAGSHHDDEAAHSSHECVLAQPEQGPALAAPCPGLPAEGAPGAAGLTAPSHPATAIAVAGATPPDLRRTAVLRI
ncbi:hypothetical protein ACH4TX_20620 [Streptomyces sp. NPDC021098]|uniref:hypothetical protein n=1 Tax=unclassified Streptomyces TaxID=2593676 RepID=UPI0037A889A1